MKQIKQEIIGKAQEKVVWGWSMARGGVQVQNKQTREKLR